MRTRRSPSPAGCWRDSTATTPSFASAPAPPSATTRRRAGSRCSTSAAIASISTTGACSRPRNAWSASSRPRTLAIDDALWEQVKLHYIGLLIEHKQPECAETFFNSVSVKILHRAYFHNRFIFVRPTLSTEHIDADPPSYRSYYPLQRGLRHAVIDIVLDCRLELPFEDFRRDLAGVLRAFRRRFPRPFRLEANHQVQVLSSLFFRNQTAYVVGRVINGVHLYPFVVAVRHAPSGKLRLDALAHGRARPRRAVLGEPRLLPGRHGGAFRVRRVPAHHRAGQDGRRALHHARAAEAGQEPLLPRFPASPQAFARPLHHRARASAGS